jgi:hypothetical protein
MEWMDRHVLGGDSMMDLHPLGPLPGFEGTKRRLYQLAAARE